MAFSAIIPVLGTFYPIKNAISREWDIEYWRIFVKCCTEIQYFASNRISTSPLAANETGFHYQQTGVIGAISRAFSTIISGVIESKHGE